MTHPSSTHFDVALARREAIRRLAGELRSGQRVVLSTHVNADGDGCGSEVALVHLLGQLGMKPRIVNPTPWPATFNFLLDDGVVEQSSKGVAALRLLDALLVVDISEIKRLGALAAPAKELTVPKLVIDHHVPVQEPAGDIMYIDPAACATGELVYDFARELGLEITKPIATALYCAILTDTGGFRFSNTSPRCHAIAADLLTAGVDPETMYRRIYASVSPGKLFLLRDALDSLQIDEVNGISWISLPAGALERYGVESDELDGIVEHPRSVAGTRLALFFRDLGYGKVKVSFRSTGDVDANRFARQFGGGGHTRASGALIPGALDDVRDRVLSAAREYVAAEVPDGGGSATAA